MFRTNLPPLCPFWMRTETDFPARPVIMAKLLFRKSTREAFPLSCAFRATARLSQGLWFPPYKLGNSASLHD